MLISTPWSLDFHLEVRIHWFLENLSRTRRILYKYNLNVCLYSRVKEQWPIGGSHLFSLVGLCFSNFLPFLKLIRGSVVSPLKMLFPSKFTQSIENMSFLSQWIVGRSFFLMLVARQIDSVIFKLSCENSICECITMGHDVFPLPGWKISHLLFQLWLFDSWVF